MNGHIGKHFPVEFDIGFFQAVHELAVSHPVSPDGGVDAGNPQSAEISFAGAPVAIGIGKCFLHRLPRFAERAASYAPESLCHAENFFPSPSRYGSINCSGHSFLLSIRQQRLDTLGIPGFEDAALP